MKKYNLNLVLGVSKELIKKNKIIAFALLTVIYMFISYQLKHSLKDLHTTYKKAYEYSDSSLKNVFLNGYYLSTILPKETKNLNLSFYGTWDLKNGDRNIIHFKSEFFDVKENLNFWLGGYPLYLYVRINYMDELGNVQTQGIHSFIQEKFEIVSINSKYKKFQLEIIDSTTSTGGWVAFSEPFIKKNPSQAYLVFLTIIEDGSFFVSLLFIIFLLIHLFKYYKLNSMLYLVCLMLFLVYYFTLPSFVETSTYSAFNSWAAHIFQNGIGKVYDLPSNNYLPIYQYILWLYGLIQNGILEISQNIHYLKIFSLLIEFIAVFFVINLVSNKNNNDKNKDVIYALLILANPAYLYNSLFFGQIDGILTTLLFISIFFAVKNNFIISIIFYVLALNCKFQSIIFFPIFLLINLPHILNDKKINNIIKSLLTVILTQLFILLPFILAGTTSQVIQVVGSGTVNVMPFLAPSANSFWRWFILGDKGINISEPDNIFFMGLTYKTWGLIMFVFFSFLALFPLMKRAIYIVFFKKTNLLKMKHIETVLISCALVNLCFYWFNTQMHSRYSHYVIIFLAAYAFFSGRMYVYFFFSFVQIISYENDLHFLKLNDYSIPLFRPYLITLFYLLTIIFLFYELYVINYSKEWFKKLKTS